MRRLKATGMCSPGSQALFSRTSSFTYDPGINCQTNPKQLIFYASLSSRCGQRAAVYEAGCLDLSLDCAPRNLCPPKLAHTSQTLHMAGRMEEARRRVGGKWEALYLKPHSSSGSEFLGVREVWLRSGLLEHEWVLLLVLFVTFKHLHMCCLLPLVPLTPRPTNVKMDLSKIILKLQAGKELTTRRKKKKPQNSIRVKI